LIDVEPVNGRAEGLAALSQLVIATSAGKLQANALNALGDVQDACFLPLASC
jgi:hypothetical protein